MKNKPRLMNQARQMNHANLFTEEDDDFLSGKTPQDDLYNIWDDEEE